jgi:hypothetical protein
MYQPTLRPIARYVCSVIGLALSMGAFDAVAVDTTTGAPTSGSAVAASRPTDDLVSKFAPFAGSTANAQALVGGLRTGGDITLQSTTPTVPDATFNAPTAPMGFGNIKIALSLAQAQLSAQGITQPTPAQIETALLGGSLNAPNGTVDVPGVLAMRSAGQGWGEIAHTLGVKVGDVVRSDKARPADKDVGAAEVPKPQRAERSDRAERGERAERAERPEKIERVSRVDRPERVERVERVERPERPERPERVERPERPERAERPERGNP